jgi:hypothetical protein
METTPATTAETQQPESKTFTAPVSAGKPEIAKFPLTAVVPEAQTQAPGATIEEGKNNADAATPEIPAAEINDDQVKEYLEKKYGIPLDENGIEGLKEKLKPADPALTEDQKKAAEAAFEKRMLDHFIENGGTPEDFVALKQVASADLKLLSESEIRRELKENGFSEEDILAVLKERYYQINPEEITRDEENESEEQFQARKALLEKKIAFGSKKFESKSSYIKKQAENALADLRAAITNQDLQKVEEAQISSKVEEIVSKIPRKLTFELGEINQEKIDPISYDVADAVVAEVTEMLKDPVKRKQFLQNEDGSLNLENIAGVLLRNKYLESALKATYVEARNREVEKVEKIFPGRAPKEVGLGGADTGNKNGRAGHLVSKGKPERVVR